MNIMLLISKFESARGKVITEQNKYELYSSE